MAKMLISLNDSLEARLREAVPAGQLSAFIAEQVERGLDERGLQSMDDAVLDIIAHDRELLDRLGDVSR